MKSFCFICGLLGSFLILSTAQAAFNDVPSTHPNYESINYVQAKGIVQGYADGTFKPDNPINRAELTKIIMATNLEADTISSCPLGTIALSDVPVNAWFAPFVCSAKQNSVIQGYPDGTFKPAQNVTFVESAKIISLGFGENLAPDPELWYRPYVSYLSGEKAIPSSINDVAQNITRGEMAEMIYRLHAAVSSRPASEFTEDQTLATISTDTEAQAPELTEIEAGTENTAGSGNTGSTTNTGSADSGNGSNNSGGNSGSTNTLVNPMVCKSCPSATIGQPDNNCACEDAYIYEFMFSPEQCQVVRYTCGEGYDNFSNAEGCGCKLKEEIIEYWLASDPNFKLNTLEEFAPIIHGSYAELTPASLEAHLGNKNLVLFFHAPWCPSCQATDQEIVNRITELPEDAIIFKNDYDSETTLREKFEITQQHSIVIINKQNQLMFKQTGFSFDDIKSVLEKIGEEETE